MRSKVGVIAGLMFLGLMAGMPPVLRAADDVTIRLGVGELGSMTPMALSPDGRVMTTGLYYHFMDKPDAVAKEVPDAPTSINDVAFSKDGVNGAAIGFGGGVVVWKVNEPGSGTEVAKFTTDQAGTSVRFTPDGESLVIAIPGAIQTWSIKSGTMTSEVKVNSRVGQRVVLSPDLRFAAAKYLDDDPHASVRLWDATTGKKLKDIPFQRTVMHDPAFSADGTLIAAATKGPAKLDIDVTLGGPKDPPSRDSSVEVIEIESREPSLLIAGAADRLAFSVTNDILAIGSSVEGENAVYAVNLKTRVAIGVAKGLENPVNGIAVSDDGMMVVFAYPANTGDHITAHVLTRKKKEVVSPTTNASSPTTNVSPAPSSTGSPTTNVSPRTTKSDSPTAKGGPHTTNDGSGTTNGTQRNSNTGR